VQLDAMLTRPTPQSHPHLPWTFVVCWNAMTQREESYVVAKFFQTPEEAEAHTRRWHRNWEYRSHEPWSEQTHGHRMIFPVPIQNVKFYVKKPDLERPDPRRKSVLITPKRLNGTRIFGS